MADGAQPLTDEERAELEALRAEKAARLEREQAERERAELEALRAESAQAKAGESPAQGAVTQRQSQPATTAQRRVESSEDRRIREARARGEKLMKPDDDLRMPTGQKFVLAGIALLVVIVLLMSYLIK